MKCLNCHKIIDDDSKFCPLCGKPILTERICPGCGLSNSLSSRFCKECGTPLEEVEASAPKTTKKVETTSDASEEEPKHNCGTVAHIFSIVSMSLMFLAMVMIFGFAFSPFMKDDFYPDSTFTIIGFLKDYFDPKPANLTESYGYIEFSSVLVLIILFSALLIATIILAAINVSKFVKAIKEKEYHDFSKPVIILYVLFLGTFFFFTSMCIRTDYYMGCIYSPGIISGIIFIPIFLTFNLFTKEYTREGEVDIPVIIMRSVPRLIALIIILIIGFNLAGEKFNIVARIMKNDTGTSYESRESFTVGSMNALDYFIKSAKFLYPEVKDIITEVYTALAISVLVEATALVLLLQLVVSPLHVDINNKDKNIFKIILISIVIASLITIMVFCNIGKDSMEKIDNFNLYNAIIKSNVSLNGTAIALVLSFLLLGVYISSAILERTVIRSRTGDEED